MTGRLTLAALDREVRKSELMTDEMISELTYQVVRLEEILAAPWWRRWRVVSRLRKDLRASVAQIDGADFAEKRVNTLGTGWIMRPDTRVGLPS